MKLVGLGGGIGAGKSSVSALLRRRGATIIDADLIAREVVEPGTPALAALAGRFGPGVVRADGALDRPALAAIVFSDAEELAALNAITHPAINAEMARRVDEHAGTDDIVVYDAALLLGAARQTMVGRIVVDVDPEVAIARLIEFRGFSEVDARARVAAQISRAERVARADFVVDNSGTLDELEAEAERLWHWIATLPPSVAIVPEPA